MLPSFKKSSCASNLNPWLNTPHDHYLVWHLSPFFSNYISTTFIVSLIGRGSVGGLCITSILDTISYIWQQDLPCIILMIPGNLYLLKLITAPACCQFWLPLLPISTSFSSDCLLAVCTISNCLLAVLVTTTAYDNFYWLHPIVSDCHDGHLLAVPVTTTAYGNFHCPGALLVCILTSNKTWRTRNAVRSSNGDCEKTTQHFAMMSASDLFVGYIRPTMTS